MSETCQMFESENAAPTKSPPLQHLILLQSSDRPYSLASLKVQATETKSSRIRTSWQSPKENVLISTCKRRMSSLKKRGYRRSGTILHAVPGTTACATALICDEQDMTALQHQDVGSRSKATSANTSPTLTSSNTSATGTSRGNGSPATSNQPFQPKELKAYLSNKSLKDSIGIYKYGKIQWQQTNPRQLGNNTRNYGVEDKTTKPRIQVVIPAWIRERPLPALPFFETASEHHSAAASFDNVQDVSPPSSGSKFFMRNSVVSPLNQTRPLSFGQFQRSMSRVVRSTPVRAPRQNYPTSKHSGSSVDSHDSDTTSVYTDDSSETSIEPDSPRPNPIEMHRYSIQNPVAAGVFDSPRASVRQHIPPPTTSRISKYPHHPPIEQDLAFQPTCSLRRSRNTPGSLSRQSTKNERSSKRSNSRRCLITPNGAIDRAISRSTSRQRSNSIRSASPTLSEAENELEEELVFLGANTQVSVTLQDSRGLEGSAMQEPRIVSGKETQETATKFVDSDPTNSLDVETSATPPPVVPRKSSKRNASCEGMYRLSHLPRSHIASQMEKGRSAAKTQRLRITIPEYKRIDDAIRLSPVPVPAKSIKRIITPSCAESVILNIYRSLDNLEDLFATAVVNKGFFRVFERHELDLIRATLKKMSPPAWEYREIAFPGHDLLHDEDLEMTRPQEEYTPRSYLQLQKHDMHTMRSIKFFIREKCQSYIRPEMATALISSDRLEAARVDDALWRIWTFCKIFGSGKGREDDIVAQQDWLKGGPMVHQQACTFSITSSDYMNSTLISAPESFAKGNGGGLTAEQLFDMIELWNCLKALLHDFSNHTAQARECGVYEKTDIRGGDIGGEESMLEEWCSYVLTFGLSAVLGLASSSHQEPESPFKSAAQQGWMEWNPPVAGNTRRYFLQEAASRVYEEKIARTFAAHSTRKFQRECQMSKARCQNFPAELRQRRVDTTDMPRLSFSQERPMSEWSTTIGGATVPHPDASREAVSYVPRVRSALAQELTASIAELPPGRMPSPPITRSVAQPLLPTPPPSVVPSICDRNSTAMSMPSIDEYPAHHRPEPLNQNTPSLIDHPVFRHNHTITPSNLGPSQYSEKEQYEYQGHSRQSSCGSHDSGDHPAFQQHPKQHSILASAAHENTAEKAIYRIVDMGFTADEAREALRITDLGDGLKVNRAVGLLLSRKR
ncbi:hypothetical protein HBI09_190690 [Parastagonospora nodorum]|nr:hypothetical protein HBI09_190690 [Parastagonospora nodorum]KAH4988574.1 hypothetical protein HBI77_215060 [Parastagonospora nodorum]